MKIENPFGERLAYYEEGNPGEEMAMEKTASLALEFRVILDHLSLGNTLYTALS